MGKRLDEAAMQGGAEVLAFMRQAAGASAVGLSWDPRSLHAR